MRPKTLRSKSTHTWGSYHCPYYPRTRGQAGADLSLQVCASSETAVRRRYSGPIYWISHRKFKDFRRTRRISGSVDPCLRRRAQRLRACDSLAFARAIHCFPKIGAPLHIEPEIGAIAKHACQDERSRRRHSPPIVTQLVDVPALNTHRFGQRSLGGCINSSMRTLPGVPGLRLGLDQEGAQPLVAEAQDHLPAPSGIYVPLYGTRSKSSQAKLALSNLEPDHSAGGRLAHTFPFRSAPGPPRPLRLGTLNDERASLHQHL